MCRGHENKSVLFFKKKSVILPLAIITFLLVIITMLFAIITLLLYPVYRLSLHFVTAIPPVPLFFFCLTSRRNY